MRFYTSTVKPTNQIAVMFIDGEPVLRHLHHLLKVMARVLELNDLEMYEVADAVFRKHSLSPYATSSLTPGEARVVNDVICFLYSPETAVASQLFIANINEGYSLAVDRFDIRQDVTGDGPHG